MTVFPELRDEARAILSEYGEDIVVRRPTTSYNAMTRSTSSSSGLTQALKAVPEVPTPGNQFRRDGLTREFSKVFYASPVPVAGAEFEPRTGDKLDHGSYLWNVAEIKVERNQGVATLYVIGCDAA